MRLEMGEAKIEIYGGIRKQKKKFAIISTQHKIQGNKGLKYCEIATTAQRRPNLRTPFRKILWSKFGKRFWKFQKRVQSRGKIKKLVKSTRVKWGKMHVRQKDKDTLEFFHFVGRRKKFG